MRSRMRKCFLCNDYTLKEICRRCGSETKNPLPPKFSPKDPYGGYRRKVKYERSRSA
ncbi:MAG: RNA-protein complex protein Nop10 [Candidatus Methanospirareceae archaeon]